MSLEEMLDDIPHRSLDLPGDGTDPLEHDPHRPELKVWASADEDMAHVTFSLSALWGQPLRFVDMTPSEARKLAALLTDAAMAVEKCEAVS